MLGLGVVLLLLPYNRVSTNASLLSQVFSHLQILFFPIFFLFLIKHSGFLVLTVVTVQYERV